MVTLFNRMCKLKLNKANWMVIIFMFEKFPKLGEESMNKQWVPPPPLTPLSETHLVQIVNNSSLFKVNQGKPRYTKEIRCQWEVGLFYYCSQQSSLDLDLINILTVDYTVVLSSSLAPRFFPLWNYFCANLFLIFQVPDSSQFEYQIMKWIPKFIE